MRKIIIAIVAAIALGPSSASGQIYDEYKSLGDNMAINRSIEAVGVAGVLAGQARLGQMKIRAGAATTRIATSPEAEVIPKLPPADQPLSRSRLAAFHTLMRTNSLAEYDIAHGFAQAFVLAFEAYTGEAPGSARLSLLARDLRAAMLRDPFSQGEQMASQQRQYENMALASMAAIEARRAGDANTAKALAAPVIRRVWNRPVENIELTAAGFGDRGERLVSSPQSVVRYVRTNDRTWVNARIQAFATDPQYLAQLPARFDAEVRKLGWSPDNPDDGLTTAFILLARAQKAPGAESAAFAQRARAFIERDSRTNAGWVGRDDKSKQNAIEYPGFIALVLLEQQATTKREYNWGQFASAANSTLRTAFRKDFIDYMGVPTIY